MDGNRSNSPSSEEVKQAKRSALFIQVALSLATLTLLINPLLIGLFLHLHPDAFVYLLTLDALFVVLFGLSIAYLRTKREVYRRAFLMALLSAPFVLVGSELFLSLWRLRELDTWRSEEIHDVYEAHPLLGWRPIPNGRGRHVSEGNFDVAYEIDDLGRKAIPKNFDDGPTLHFFGDSYGFGHGVSNEDAALNVFAQGLARERGFNVANYSVMGYGLEQMLTRLKIHQDRVRPGDYVIFIPTSFDLLRNMIHKRFLCQFPVRRNTPVGKLMMRKDGDWTPVDLVESCDLTENLLLQSNFVFGFVYHSIRDRMLHPALTENADAIFEEAQSLARSAGAAFFLVFLAVPWECQRKGLDFDLTHLRSDYRSMLEHCPDLPLRFPTDVHWSPQGHRWVAQFLEEQLDPVLQAEKPLL